MTNLVRTALTRGLASKRGPRPAAVGCSCRATIRSIAAFGVGPTIITGRVAIILACVYRLGGFVATDKVGIRANGRGNGPITKNAVTAWR